MKLVNAFLKAVIACSLFALSVPSFAGTFKVFGTEIYERTKGSPVVISKDFNVLNPNTEYTLYLHNGGLQDDETTGDRVSSSIINVNGTEVIAPNDLNQKTESVSKSVNLAVNNRIEVEVRGKPGGLIAVEVIGVDNDAPEITATIDRQPNINNWFNTDVVVSFQCSDAISGIASCPNPITVSTEAANQIISGETEDNAGNKATASVSINIDKTLPTITSSTLPLATENGWFNSDVILTYQCSDELSGIENCPIQQTISTEGLTQNIEGQANDLADNNALVSTTLNIDKTPPTITATVNIPPNFNGWYNEDVIVSFECSDTLSGIEYCPTPITVTSEGANQEIMGQAVDNSGNTSNATVSLNIDKTAPQIVENIQPSPNNAGWNNTNVAVSFTCTDELSLISSCSPMVNLTNEGAFQFQNGTAIDLAGNTASREVIINIDKTTPTGSFISPLSGSTVVNNPINIVLNYADNLQIASDKLIINVNGLPATKNCLFGLSDVTCELTEALSIGPKTLTAILFDMAGNSQSIQTEFELKFDTDLDGVLDENDKFPSDPKEWADLDSDGIGDNSDLDRDGDGISNDYEERLFFDPNNASSIPPDLDSDTIPDAFDEDRDGDGVNNELDLFPSDATETTDFDKDGVGDNSDPDRDGDKVDNENDVFPDDPNESADLDGDGTGDNSDNDRDGDGFDNENDAFPNDATQWKLPVVLITTPVTLSTLGASPSMVSGTIDDPEATLTVNGIPVNHAGGNWSVNVAIEEGHNSIIARAVDARGNEVTATVSVSLDTTAPYVTVQAPADGSKVYAPTIAVTGLINDIVRGTVNEAQANVTVNGVSATVVNRSYIAENIVLTEGQNLITINAADQVGNTNSVSVTVEYIVPQGKQIELLSQQNQSALIGTKLAEDIMVKLTNEIGEPVVGKNTIFRVIQGDGILAINTGNEGQGVIVQTDENGQASTSFRVGSRAGQGNHRVRVTAVGYEAEVVVHASAESNPGDKISIQSGNNQRGPVGQPLPQPFIVTVTDEGSNFVQGAAIEFSVSDGSGKFHNGETTFLTLTDSDGRASVQFTLGNEAGLDNHRVTAMIKETDLIAGFNASALVPGDPGNTIISGVVLDNQDKPLPGVTIRVDGTTRQAKSNEFGQFKITEAPVGPVHLIADASTTTVAGEWPALSYNLVTVAGAENPLSAPIYMVKLDTENAVWVGDKDMEMVLDKVPGFKLEVKAGSVTFPDGAKEGLLSVTPVNANKIPMAPPNGMQPQLIVTIQPVGAKFDPPARLTLPNVDGHRAGAEVEMFSYDHDLEEFVSIGLGTVSNDGSIVQSNPGIGVIKAGWHCGTPPDSDACAHRCPECKTCPASCSGCFADDKKLPKSIKEIDNDCKKIACRGGGATRIPDDNDKPFEECMICKAGEIVTDPNCLQFDLVAKDKSTIGVNNVRQSGVGQALVMVKSVENSSQVASINIVLNKGQFEDGDPIWGGQTSGSDGDTQVEYSGTQGQRIIASAANKAKSIQISIIGKEEEKYTLIPGTSTVTAVMDSLSGEVSFGTKNRFTASYSVKPEGKRWNVERPNSPETTHSYSGGASVTGSIAGRIVHPTFSGQFPPKAFPGDPVLLWEVYGEASGIVEGTVSYSWLNEYNPPRDEFNGTAYSGINLKAGVFGYAEFPGYEVTGGASGSVGAGFTVTTSGQSPNKVIEGYWSVDPVKLDALLQLKRTSDGNVKHEYAFSYTVWEGIKGDKTVLFEQPINQN